MTEVDDAVALVRAHGWLSQQPASFQARVVERMRVLDYQACDFLYRRGDPLGGIYGLVAGVVAVDIAPPPAIPAGWSSTGLRVLRRERVASSHVSLVALTSVRVARSVYSTFRLRRWTSWSYSSQRGTAALLRS